MSMQERSAITQLIKEWNENRLDLFEISEVNQDLEFHGVMRYYFQDAGQKIATKCIRVSSTASTTDVISILIEKFRPDIRMLSINSEYALFETYENGEERKLADEEKPLLVQLNWHHDDREGRFLLRRMDEKSYLPGFDATQSNFKRKLSKRDKKEKRKAEKEMRMQNKQQSGSRENEAAVTKVAEKLYTEVPENSFTRSISNPEAVMRRRRKQKLEKKLQQFCQEGGLDAGGTLRIFGETLNPDVPYKTLLLSTQDTANYVVREILDKYGKEKEECNDYCLVQLIVPHELANGTPLSDCNGNPAIREYILDEDDCPLAIEKQHQRVRGSLSFHIRRRPADYQPRKRKKKPLHLKPEFEVNSEEILQRLHSLNPTTNNHLNHNHHHNNNNDRNGSNQMQQQLQQQGADSGITSSGSREQQLVMSEMQVPQKYMNESERTSTTTNSQSISQQHFADDPAVVPQSPSALIPNHPVATSSAAVTDGSSGHHFFPSSESQQLHQQQQMLHQQQRDRRSGSDQGHDSVVPAGVPMNGVSAGQQLLAKRQNTGPDVDVIIFKKGNGGMGLSIVATQGLGQQKLGIYIKNVVPGGAADEDGRLQAGDQLLAVDGNSLIGVTQEQAAELISKTGPQVTLEVARNAAAYYGLANLLNQPSPQVARHPRIMSHSQSYANQPQAQRQASLQQQYMSQQFLPQSATLPTGMTGHGMQQPVSYANAPVTPSVMASGAGAPHLMQQAGPGNGASLLQSQSSLVQQEERHYQNISMYRQPQPPLPNPPNGLASANASVRALNSTYPHPPHHNSYSSLHALPGSSQNSQQQQQINSSTLPGRPMSTVYPNNMMGRVSSMAQYPTFAGPSSQMQLQAQAHQQQQMYRSGHTGSVPALHPSHSQWGRDGVPYGGQMYPSQGNGTIPGMSHMSQQQQLYGRNVAGGMMPPPQPSRVSIVSTKGLIDGEQPPTGYRYVPSAYPTKSMDSLNNNNNMMMNGHNNNNMNWRRNKNNSSSSQEFNAQIEEQEERLRLLKLEEMKRHHELEVAQIQIAEDRLLKEAKTRRGQDEDVTGMKMSRAHQEPEVPPPLPKSPPPLDPVNQPPIMSHQPFTRPDTSSRVAFRNHLMQPVSSDDGRHPPSSMRLNGDMGSGYVPSAAPVPPKKMVSWNDTTVQQTAALPPVSSTISSPAEVLTNGGTSSSGITLEDIDEVLGSSAEQDEPSALIPNTPNVIGSQEVYRDPRERMMQEKMKNKAPVTAQGPEKLSFKEKMQMFAIQQQQNAGASSSATGQKGGSSSLKSSGARDSENGNANCIPEEES